MVPFSRSTGVRTLQVVGILMVLAGIFFVGRRIYYRLIQPAPLWTVATPREERIVCAEGFEISLWADESLVHNPTNLWIDERDRVWITEAKGYRRSSNPHVSAVSGADWEGDCVVILDDQDQDGTADTRTVFAQDPDLVAPLGICVLGHRVFVSCSPHILLFTDDDGDDRADRKDILLTGFGGHDHDHGVHSLVPGPDGRLYFAVGNAGPHVVTDKSGWTLRSGSYYQTSQSLPPEPTQDGATMGFQFNVGGLTSDDGRVYAGGLVLSVKPDGTDLKVHSHNARNPYEVVVDSHGDLWQSDNDDTASSRLTWLMEGSNTGFASANGDRSWQIDQRPGQSLSDAHWHQQDPGVIPAGFVYGVGAPTGMLRCESRSLGSELKGALLACEAGLGAVLALQPKDDRAGYTFERSRLVWSEQQSPTAARPDGLALTWFRPSDLALSSRGELFIADWYDSYVGGHRVNDEDAAGRIYRLRRARDTQLQTATKSVVTSQPPSSSEPDVVADLKSDSLARRWRAFEGLLAMDEAALPFLRTAMESDNPFVAARAVWILASLNDSGRQVVDELMTHPDSSMMTHPDSSMRIAAFRALVANGVPAESLVGRLVSDPSPMVRREALVRLRGTRSEVADLLRLQLASSLDLNDRTALTAVGLSCEGIDETMLQRFQQEVSAGRQTKEWLTELCWQLHPPSALSHLKSELEESTSWSDMASEAPRIRRIVDAIGFVGDAAALQTLEEFATQIPPATSEETTEQSTLRELIIWWRGRLKSNTEPIASMNRAPLTGIRIEFQTPARGNTDSQILEAIELLQGDANRGATLFFSATATCSGCHRWQSRGGEVGPALDEIGRRLSRRQLIESIIDPSSAILTGYESWTAAGSDGLTVTGLLLSVDDQITLRTADGRTQSVPVSSTETLIRRGDSLMPANLVDKLSHQDIADIVQFLTRAESPLL
jgi:putative membrane-bound dehydrogenase-like protein